ncbi:MAG TPA: tetratricopeptide repeat protein [Gemmata sp.]|nr:tetratricopeptide repeat protein [Gemmata sp.]
MSDQPTVGLPAGATGQETIDSLSRLYELAWAAVKDGQDSPQVERFLACVTETEREALEDKLRQIAARYEQSAGRQSSSDFECDLLSSRDTPSAVSMEHTSRTPPLDQNFSSKTIEYQAPPAPKPPPDVSSGATVNYESREPEGGEGVDPFGGTVSFDQNLRDEPYGAGPTLREVGTADHPRPTVPGYEILGELGRGGMGVVYKARQSGLNRLVALKMVLAGAHAGEHQLKRFQTEAEAVARLDHPNIVRIHEVGEHDGLPYFSLEFVQGGSLSEAIGGKPRPPRQAAALVEHLTQAMAIAHQHGIIHRDLKSANVLLTLDGTPKITDFGLAKSLESDSEVTKSGTLMGTPSYMSPEQARGDTRAIGPLSDLYSLGAILYELLTGRPPFLAPSMLEVLYQVRNQEPVPPCRLQPHVPKDLETICLKCLQKEPEKRYAGCRELAEDLRRFRGGEAIRARPVGKMERAWRWCRRNPRTATLSLAIGILTCVVAASLTLVVSRMNREREATAQTRNAANDRIEQAGNAVYHGDYRRAQELLALPDPLLEKRAELQDVRDRRDTLGSQVAAYAQFKQLLDDARFDCRFGSLSQKAKGQQTCKKLLKFYDDIEQREGSAANGLPPLNEEQQLRFKEDAFEAFLVAATVERQLAINRNGEEQTRAARQALAWLNRADQILPGRHILHILRAECWNKLGDPAAEAADMENARTLRAQPSKMAVDRFWRAFADHTRGNEARQKGDPEKAADGFFRKAIAEYCEFLQERPDDFWGYFNWAYCLLSLNDFDDATIALTTCMRLRPDFPWPYNNRGVIQLRRGRNDQAIKDFTAAVSLNPRYAEAWENRGIAHAALGQAPQAIDDLTRAIELNPDSTLALAKRAEIYRTRKDYANTIRDYDRLIALTPDKAPLHLQRAELYQAMSKNEDALRDYDRAVSLAKANPAAYFGRAGLHYQLRDYVKARDDYSKVIELAPPRAPAVAVAYSNRAIINWIHLKEFDAALKDYTRVTQLDPKNAEPYRCIGSILLGRRAYTEALDATQQALERKPGYVEVVWLRAQIHLWQGRPKEALAELDPVIARLAREKPETLNVRGDVYRSLGEYDKAAADYRRMIELRPKDPNAYIGLALALKNQGKPEEAKLCYDRMIAADPDSAAAYLRRAEFRRDHGQFDLARADCEQAARLDAESVLPALVRAGVDAANGHYREAIDRAEAALKRAPQNDGRVLYAAACVWSLASAAARQEGSETVVAKEYADRAAKYLTAALDRGFHDLVFPEHNRMTADPALAPIRAHPNVRELLAGRP